MSLLKKIKEFTLPEIRVDKERRVYEILSEGLLFNNLTELYFTLKGYSRYVNASSGEAYSERFD